MAYACVFLVISLHSCPSHLGILEIFPHYPIPCHFILYKCCTVSQCMNICNLFNQSPCSRWTLRCFCTQCYSEHPCLIFHYGVVTMSVTWGSGRLVLKKPFHTSTVCFNHYLLSTYFGSLSQAPRLCVRVRRPKQLCFRRCLCFCYLSHTQCVLCAGSSWDGVTFTSSSAAQQPHEAVIIHAHFAEECQAQRC